MLGLRAQFLTLLSELPDYKEEEKKLEAVYAAFSTYKLGSIYKLELTMDRLRDPETIVSISSNLFDFVSTAHGPIDHLQPFYLGASYEDEPWKDGSIAAEPMKVSFANKAWTQLVFTAFFGDMRGEPESVPMLLSPKIFFTTHSRGFYAYSNLALKAPFTYIVKEEMHEHRCKHVRERKSLQLESKYCCWAAQDQDAMKKCPYFLVGLNTANLGAYLRISSPDRLEELLADGYTLTVAAIESDPKKTPQYTAKELPMREAYRTHQRFHKDGFKNRP